MRAITVEEPGVARIVDVENPDDAIRQGDALVRVLAVGLCGTDLKTFQGTNPLVHYPRVIGHELYGEVVKLPEYGTRNLKKGDRVTVYPYSHCGRCSACRKGRQNCCKNNRTLGVQRDGGGCDFITVPPSVIVPVGTLSADAGVLVEPLSVAYHAAIRAQVEPNDVVAVVGCGMIGLGVIAAASHMGATVIAVDIAGRKLEQARSVGATHAINADSEDLTRRLAELTDDQGPDTIIEAVGSARTFRQAVEQVCFAGRVVYIGYAAEQVQYDPKHFVSKELDVRGSRNATPEDFRSVIELLENGAIEVEPLVSHRFAAADAPEALKPWSKSPSEVTKIVVSFGEQ